jgi:peptide/nickel transport system substrate-binding protein
MYAIAQEDMLRAQVGDPDVYKVCNAPFICGTRFGKEYGDLLIKPNLEKARALLKESGYDGTPVVMLHQTDLQSSNNLQPVAKQQLEKAGFKVDLQSMDWQTVVTRRAKKGPPSEGGWNIFFTTTITLDADNPGTNSFASGACEKAWFGWPCDPEITKLREAFADESDEAKRMEIVKKIQLHAAENPTHAFLGQFVVASAMRKNITGALSTSVPVYWNIEKK